MKTSWRVVAPILLVVFGVEAIVMMVLNTVPPIRPVAGALVDALALTILGAIILWFVVGRPLARREAAESAATRESEERSRIIVEAVSDAIIVIDQDSRIIRFANARIETILGYSPQELEDKDLTLLMPERHRDDHKAGVKRYLETGVRHLDWGGTEARGLHKSGKEVALEIAYGEYAKGAERYFVGVLRDVTERRRAEADRLLQSTALNAAADPMVITDRDGTIVWINAAFTECTGYSAEEAIGKNPRALVKSGVHDKAFYKELWDTVLAGNVWRGEMTNRRKDGNLYPELQTITPVRDVQGEISHFIGVKRDLTKEKQLQAQFLQAQKMEAVGRLAGAVAHDFNNLLTVIGAHAEFALAELAATDSRREDFNEIGKAAASAAGLTRQLLAFSRQQVIQPRLVTLEGAVADCRKMLGRLLGEDIDVTTELASSPLHVMIDPSQLEQVIMNLAINARDSMPSGGRLTIRTTMARLDEEFVRANISGRAGRFGLLAVTDTGTGMDEATQARIFEPFFTTKAVGKGTGLGLSTVSGIVEQGNGFIVVRSEPGLGTTFECYFPLVEETVDEVAPPVTGALPLGTESVLLVEDAPSLRKVVRTMLEQLGYSVLEAPDGRAALDFAAHRDTRIDLVLADVVMPRMGGRELAEQVRTLHPEAKMLYMSGYTDDSVLRQGVLDASVALLQKPFSKESLAYKLREALGAEHRM